MGIEAGFIILIENKDVTLGNELVYFHCKANQKGNYLSLPPHFQFIYFYPELWTEGGMSFVGYDNLLLLC